MREGTTGAKNAADAKHKFTIKRKNNELTQFLKLTIVARWFLLISGPRVRVPGGAPNHENPNLFSIGEGFGFFVFFGNENSGSSLTAVCPKPYQKKDRITKVTTVKVP